jgi:hypothetical protein
MFMSEEIHEHAIPIRENLMFSDKPHPGASSSNFSGLGLELSAALGTSGAQPPHAELVQISSRTKRNAAAPMHGELWGIGCSETANLKLKRNSRKLLPVSVLADEVLVDLVAFVLPFLDYAVRNANPRREASRKSYGSIDLHVCHVCLLQLWFFDVTFG